MQVIGSLKACRRNFGFLAPFAGSFQLPSPLKFYHDRSSHPEGGLRALSQPQHTAAQTTACESCIANIAFAQSSKLRSSTNLTLSRQDTWFDYINKALISIRFKKVSGITHGVCLRESMGFRNLPLRP